MDFVYVRVVSARIPCMALPEGADFGRVHRVCPEDLPPNAFQQVIKEV